MSFFSLLDNQEGRLKYRKINMLTDKFGAVLLTKFGC